MEPSCVRQTLIPGTSQLFGDFLYHFERVSGFYPHCYSDWDGLLESAKGIEYPESRRAQIVSALRKQNGASAALGRLAQPGTVAIVTGQQVGLLSGPVYTIFKALTAVRIAERLTEQGTPAVPVFWLATEDHDLAEVDHAWLFNQAASPSKISVQGSAITNGPVGNVPLPELNLSEIERALDGLPYAESVTEKLKAFYGSDTTFGQAFHAFLRDILKDFDLLFLDPLAPEIREIAAPFLGQVVTELPELLSAVKRRNADLEAAGYHAQVHLDTGSSFLFRLELGRRSALKFRDNEFSLRDQTFSPEELRSRAHELSPNALLRPVMQDFLLPTLSYVGGPAEIAYMAQSAVLYEGLLGRMPVIYPRNSFTLLDTRAEKLLNKYNLHVTDLLDSHERARSTVAAKLVPEDLKTEITTLRANLVGSVHEFREKLLRFDPTLAAAADKSITKITYQIEKLATKTAREAIRRDRQAADAADYLGNLIYPHRHLQERFYSIVPFLAKHGLDLPQRLYEHVQLSCPDHMVRTL